ncbi:acyltransferase family protein [Nocardioides acrostichi]|uniref:Acyltransferase n=1 Tax=Nocardioides acrostichi TaxID=2784339 RepID=A0A930V159_9ACTN|nr:acyltransferase [Nocardioides acrostichi]MBF4161820.1 acyltransferase [Nocardioides acrostichi]
MSTHEAAASEVAERPRIDSLTGLRFPAALAVFAYHAAGHSLPGPGHDMALAVAGRGYVGVSFFFVLSGFVLTWSHRPDDTPRAFYRRRLARIMPVYWLCLAAGWALLVAGTGDLMETTRDVAPSVVGLQAWFPSAAVHYGANGPGWSISAELFFYAMFPLLTTLTATRRGRRTLGLGAAALMVVPSLLLHPTAPGSLDSTAAWLIYICPITRVAEFAVGILVAHAVRRGWRPPLTTRAALLLVLAAYVATAFVPLWATVSLVLVVPFSWLIAAAATDDLAHRTSRWGSPAARRLGEWSFAFYLVHASVLKVQHEVVLRLGADPTLDQITIALALLASVAIAAAVHRWIESPLERRWRRTPARATLEVAGSGADRLTPRAGRGHGR